MGKVSCVYFVQSCPGSFGGKTITIIITIIGYIIGNPLTGQLVCISKNILLHSICCCKNGFIFFIWFSHPKSQRVIFQHLRIVQAYHSRNSIFTGQQFIKTEVQFFITIQKMYTLVYIHSSLHPVDSGTRYITDWVFSAFLKIHSDFPFSITIGIVP